ncbi:MAG: carbonic anhydrase [Myxococcota bacterium]|nr:carbonic anhydrase [Myxococcota bacterium]
MDRIYAGIGQFQDRIFPEKRELFERLEGGQQPQLLLITCSDSRIDPALVTQTEPGEVFVIRNAGNLVAPWGDRNGGEAATVEYGIRALGIRDIAVCGHTHCGAMAALRDGGAPELPAVDRWLELGREALTRSVALDPPAADPLVETVAANVLTQLDHLRTHPSVAEAEARGALRLHGWIYDFGAGELLAADADGCFRQLRAAAREVA